ncbi:MAG: selenocysteine-specific translation elongation factor [Planctomycetota bacterium]
MTADAIYNVVLGTAGHIDHGKSSLVRQLTGIDPDRLPEEQARGLTIDLGFAPFVLSTGERVGIIDVPGHERFVKNMVAGATGIDIVALVVAADDSVMPQTREHIDIMTLIGVRRGVIVINKIDLVEPAMVELVEDEIREAVKGTFLDGAPAYYVSATTGAGIPELRAALETHLRGLPPRSTDGIFRMPIQRVFSAHGHGTVVTGIPVSGRVELQDRLEILPLGVTGRVRGLQAYKQTVTQARAGHSTAINLSDVDFHAVHRGMVAAVPGYFQATTMIEARVRVLAHLDQPVRHQTPIRFHTGTAEAAGKIYLLEDKVVEPGAETYAQFRLTEPIVVAPGDRYVFRLESPMITLGGGEILDRSAWRLKTGKAYVVEQLRRKEQALGSDLEFLASLVAETPLKMIDGAELARRAGMAETEAAKHLATLAERGDLVPVKGVQQYLSRTGLELAGKRIEGALDECYRKSPYRIHVPKVEVLDACRLDAEFCEHCLANLASRGVVRLERGGRLSLPGRALKLSGAEQEVYDLIESTFRKDLLNPPRLDELAQRSGKPLKLLEKMQALLVDQELLVRLAPDVVLLSDAIDGAAETLRKLFRDEGAFTASRAKDVLGTSRKFAIPLLEYFDRLKITRRLGDTRELGSAGGG